jgi:flagellar basal-body rod modification protein FlgD
MDTNSIGTIAGNAAAASTSASTGTGQTLGQNEFLQLLMTQLQNQDPMSPMDNTQFIAQMAQFSSLEQMTNLVSATKAMNANNEVAQSVALIGHNVTYTNADGSAGSGVVSEVDVSSGNVQLKVGDTSIDPTQINTVS